MKTLDKTFTTEELSQIAIALSHLGGAFAQNNEAYIGTKEWKSLWDLQQFFFSEANKGE